MCIQVVVFNFHEGNKVWIYSLFFSTEVFFFKNKVF